MCHLTSVFMVSLLSIEAEVRRRWM